MEVVISTLAIDTPAARNSERLSFFLTEIGADKPIDNYFDDYPLWKKLYDTRVTKTGGRQIGFPIGSGESPGNQDFQDDDEFVIEVPNSALWVAYPYVNKGDAVAVLDEELKEQEGSNHKIFDILDYRRELVINTTIKNYATDLGASSLVAGKINPIDLVIDSTGAIGGLNASTDSDWASTETSSGSFAAQGFADMRTMMNTLKTNKSMVDNIWTTQTIYEAIENEGDPDVRYDLEKTDEMKRGFSKIRFKGVLVDFDSALQSGYMYFWDSRYTYLCCDTGWNFDFEPFMHSFSKKLQASKFANRCQFLTTNRRTTGKLINMSA